MKWFGWEARRGSSVRVDSDRVRGLESTGFVGIFERRLGFGAFMAETVLEVGI